MGAEMNRATIWEVDRLSTALRRLARGIRGPVRRGRGEKASRSSGTASACAGLKSW
jgi:hypothetical protein